jgi:hypothetical protein
VVNCSLSDVTSKTILGEVGWEECNTKMKDLGDKEV